MPDRPMTEAEAIARFSRELEEISARGPAPDCAEQMAAIHAEHEAECAKLRQTTRKPGGREAGARR